MELLYNDYIRRYSPVNSAASWTPALSGSHVPLPVPPRLAAISLSSRRAIMSDPNILSITRQAPCLLELPVERHQEMPYYCLWSLFESTQLFGHRVCRVNGAAPVSYATWCR